MTAMTDHSTLDPTSLRQDQTYPGRYRYQSMHTDASVSTVSDDEGVVRHNSKTIRFYVSFEYL